MTAAYGVRFGSPEGPEHWPLWEVDVRVQFAGDAQGMSIWPDAARIGMPGAGEMLLDRRARRVTFAVRRPPSPETIVHPGLAPAAVVIAHWSGGTSLHAAAVVVDGAAWALLGGRAAGKSTMAALLCERGCGLFTDDVLVAAAGRACAGPGTIDLRADPARLLGGERLADRDRWRLHAARPLLEAPLAGFVALEWADRASVTRLAAGERLARLNAQLVLGGAATAVLDLVALPMLCAQRQHDFRSAPSSADAILAAIAQEAR